jgi:hypothetical protein
MNRLFRRSLNHDDPEIVIPRIITAALSVRTLRLAQDIAIADDVARLRASVCLIGQRLSDDSGDFGLRLPEVPSDWQFLIDTARAQVIADHLSALSGVDPESFPFRFYVAESSEMQHCENRRNRRGDL